MRVKEHAVATIGGAIRSKDVRRALRPGDAIFMSSVTDPYQPIEHKLRLTRDIVEALLTVQPRLTVQTRSPIARRDIDLFQQFESIRVNISVQTYSETVRLRYEPHAPSIKERLKTAEALRTAGVPIGICVSPMLPAEDASSFGRRLAGLDAAEYVATGFHPNGPGFGARTSNATVEKLRADGWTRRRYDAARAAIAAELGPDRPLLSGREGFAPAAARA